MNKISEEMASFCGATIPENPVGVVTAVNADSAIEDLKNTPLTKLSAIQETKHLSIDEFCID